MTPLQTQTKKINQISKPNYRYIPEVGFRPKKCPNCLDGQIRTMYDAVGSQWCYTCGWRTGMKVVNPDAMKSQTKKVVKREVVETRPVGFRKINLVNYGF